MEKNNKNDRFVQIDLKKLACYNALNSELKKNLFGYEDTITNKDYIVVKKNLKRVWLISYLKEKNKKFDNKLIGLLVDCIKIKIDLDMAFRFQGSFYIDEEILTKHGYNANPVVVKQLREKGKEYSIECAKTLNEYLEDKAADPNKPPQGMSQDDWNKIQIFLE